MLQRGAILTTAALMAVFAVPASAQTYDDLRSSDAKDAAEQRGLYESDGGPGAARPHTHSQPGPYPDSERKLVESPEVQGMGGGAGIGATGMVALLSIAAGSALMLIGRRRRRGVGVATH